MKSNIINIVGAGLAGCEAAWQAASIGAFVRLFEMKPSKRSSAHSTDYLAELVCSNSLRSAGLENASGLLKEELRLLNSIVIRSADENKVPAGGALAVDREAFSKTITDLITSNENIELISGEVTDLNGFKKEEPLIIATGPLTSEALSGEIKRMLVQEQLYFFDAAAPIVLQDSINFDIAFKASRYGKGGDDYINCPFTRVEYELFVNELLNAETAPIRDFENCAVFEGCMPVEVMTSRGFNTLRFGPMKPVGIIDPRTNKEPYAVVQLRQDDREGVNYNMVGFQTRLKFSEQQRVFRMIPGLENAEFSRFGVMHRNTYINSPQLLTPTYKLKDSLSGGRNVYFAGQVTGVEGYIESTSSGLVAGINAALAKSDRSIIFPQSTAIGALAAYISDNNVKCFQPMNINFGIIRPNISLKLSGSKKDRKVKIAEDALETIKMIRSNIWIK